MFCDELKMLRKQKGVTQKEVANATGINLRTLQNYEMGKCYPRKQEYTKRLAAYFNVPIERLISNEDYYIMVAGEKGGPVAERELASIIKEMRALFSGGTLSEPDKDYVLKSINEVYWDSKDKARKKYGRHE
ncbi:MAG: helix-turn-helix transcriptional regulator [Ruminococcaceae bacterium]|nr:helix-turn-helix transcriptional regulator [Oscillospiraceae bacterium]